MALSSDELAAVVARDIPSGSYVNLGIGQPTTVADHLPSTREWCSIPRTACSTWGRSPSGRRSTPT